MHIIIVKAITKCYETAN